MTLWRLVLAFALACGSVLPHCAMAAPATASHHAGMAHDEGQPSKAHVSDACIGCATPVRPAFVALAALVVTASRPVAIIATLATRAATLDPPPPRTDA